MDHKKKYIIMNRKKFRTKIYMELIYLFTHLFRPWPQRICVFLVSVVIEETTNKMLGKLYLFKNNKLPETGMHGEIYMLGNLFK